MFGHYAYQYLATRNDQGSYKGTDQGSDQDAKDPATKISVIYVTASPSFTGPIAGYTTLGTSSQSTDKTSPTSTVIVMTTSSLQSSTSLQSTTTSSSSSSSSSEVNVFTTLSSQTQEPAHTTEQIAEPLSSLSVTEAVSGTTPIPVIASPTSESSAVKSSAVLSEASLAVDPTSSAVVENLVATSLEDLPLYIASPTATVAVSVPLLVATSSTPAAIFSTPSASQPPKVIQSSAPAASETANPNPTSMTASGKVSIIFGVTLLIGTACLLYQLYFRKQRQAERERRRLEDSEKQSFDKSGVGKRISSISMSPTVTIQKPAPACPATPAKDRKLQPENRRENPFGNHAEIVVDSINASGPMQIDRVNSETPALIRVASKKGYTPQKFTTNGPNKMSRSSACTEYSVTSMAPGSMSAVTPTSAAIQAAGGPVSTVYRVNLDFSPSMDDELELRSGQLIRVLHEFDDGWAMCLRLDCSEQGVCPRACLSTRPVKPRSQSSSSQARLPPQPSQSFHTMPNQTSAISLPTSPQELPALKVESKPDGHNGPQGRPIQQQYGVPQTLQTHNISNSNNISNLSAPIISNATPTGAQSTLLSEENSVLPHSNSDAGSVNHSSADQTNSDTVGHSAPIDDYFSFTKPNDETERVDKLPMDHPSSPHHHATGSSIGIPLEYLSQPSSSQQKSIPGQAL